MTILSASHLRFAGVAVAAAGMALVTAPAMAQPYPYGPDETTVGEIVVSPPVLGRSAIGAPIRLVSTSRVVRFGDLDLGAPWGRHELRVRIERAARNACDDLEARYPVTADDSPDCYRTAVRNAMVDAEDLTGYAVASR